MDLLTDIARAPRILTNFAGAIQPANFKKVLFVFPLLSGRIAVLDYKGKEGVTPVILEKNSEILFEKELKCFLTWSNVFTFPKHLDKVA